MANSNEPENVISGYVDNEGQQFTRGASGSGDVPLAHAIPDGNRHPTGGERRLAARNALRAMRPARDAAIASPILVK